MATLTEIREGLVANLGAISGLQVSGYMLSNPTPPSAEIVPARVVYDQAMQRGLDILTLTVRVVVAYSSDIGSQRLLDSFMEPGAKCVKAALESDRTLGGIVDTLHVTEIDPANQLYGREGQPVVLGAAWTVDVYASN